MCRKQSVAGQDVLCLLPMTQHLSRQRQRSQAAGDLNQGMPVSFEALGGEKTGGTLVPAWYRFPPGTRLPLYVTNNFSWHLCGLEWSQGLEMPDDAKKDTGAKTPTERDHLTANGVQTRTEDALGQTTVLLGRDLTGNFLI
jgi:hypothetical protein